MPLTRSLPPSLDSRYPGMDTSWTAESAQTRDWRGIAGHPGLFQINSACPGRFPGPARVRPVTNELRSRCSAPECNWLIALSVELIVVNPRRTASRSNFLPWVTCLSDGCGSRCSSFPSERRGCAASPSGAWLSFATSLAANQTSG